MVKPSFSMAWKPVPTDNHEFSDVEILQENKRKGHAKAAYLVSYVTHISYATIASAVLVLLTLHYYSLCVPVSTQTNNKAITEQPPILRRQSPVENYLSFLKSFKSKDSCNISCLNNLVAISMVEFQEKETEELIIEPASPPTIALSAPELPSDDQCQDVPLEMRFDCHPGVNSSQVTCEARGCCWREINKSEIPSRLNDSQRHFGQKDVPLDLPYCFYPNKYNGYQFKNINNTSTGIYAQLHRTTTSGYPDDIPILSIMFHYETETRIRVKIYDPSESRWEPLLPEVPILKNNIQPLKDALYSVKIVEQDGTFAIIRSSTGLPLFDTRGAASLTFADQFLQLSTMLSSNYIYGLGEHIEGLLLDTYWHRRVLWNADQYPIPRANLYGSHPFYLNIEPSFGNSHGVLLLNSNALDVVLQPTPALTFHAIGGIIDMYIFLGPTPDDVVRQYTEIIGKPFLPPYWSLGYHQCRFGYNSLNRTIEVWNRTRNAGIPFDVQWNDIDYMDNSNDFTYNKDKYAGLPDFVKQLHELNMHYIPIIDPGISFSEAPGTYPPLDDGLKMDIFVKNQSNQPFIGKVWNKVSSTWPDFTHPSSIYYWAKQLLMYYKQVPFDGVWIDMNEPSNFWSGQANGCPSSNLNHPPYTPPVQGDVLYYKTLCMTTKQRCGLHYDLHNLYGFTETLATNMGLQVCLDKRPFVISRATYPGQGQYGGHWTGDVISDWDNLWRSISDILNFNMFGIPMVGADICGFNGNTTASLCLRWMQLGAFYPFSRNHNTDDGIDQDPVALGEAVVVASRNALLQRYTLLPYLYSLFFRATLDGTPVARPLFFQYPSDIKTYNLDTQFMWGSGLMIVPVLKENVTKVTAYLPSDVWYDWYDGSMVSPGGSWKYLDLPAPLDTIPLLLRGGTIVPCQTPGNTTYESRKNDFGLEVALDSKGAAGGELFWDDGESLSTIESMQFVHLSFEGCLSSIKVRVSSSGYHEPMVLGWLRILGVQSPVETVTVDGEQAEFIYDKQTKVLKILKLHQEFVKNFDIIWR